MEAPGERKETGHWLTMVNEQRALRRVGEWAGLRDETLERFLQLVHDVHTEQLEATGASYDLHQEYFTFLNEQVLSSEDVTRFIQEAGVEQEIAEQFQHGTIDIEATFQAHGKTDFDLDELVDFVMLLKFVRDYRDKTGDSIIAPRNRLQHLLYLVNFELSNEPDPYLPERDNEWGLLWRTGYRYDFRKRDTGPGSSWLYTDKDRLYAWQLLDEAVEEVGLSDIDEPFGICLGEAGQLLFTRYGQKLSNFNSMILRKWDEQQRAIIDEYGSMSQNALWEYVTDINSYQQRREGQVLLNGRPLQFDETARKELHAARRVMPIHA